MAINDAGHPPCDVVSKTPFGSLSTSRI